MHIIPFSASKSIFCLIYGRLISIEQIYQKLDIPLTSLGYDGLNPLMNRQHQLQMERSDCFYWMVIILIEPMNSYHAQMLLELFALVILRILLMRFSICPQFCSQPSLTNFSTWCCGILAVQVILGSASLWPWTCRTWEAHQGDVPWANWKTISQGIHWRKCQGWVPKDWYLASGSKRHYSCNDGAKPSKIHQCSISPPAIITCSCPLKLLGCRKVSWDGECESNGEADNEWWRRSRFTRVCNCTTSRLTPSLNANALIFHRDDYSLRFWLRDLYWTKLKAHTYSLRTHFHWQLSSAHRCWYLLLRFRGHHLRDTRRRPTSVK